MDEWAQTDPVVEVQTQGRRSSQPEGMHPQGLRNVQVPKPDVGHGAEVGGHRESDVVTGVLEAEVELLPILQQPPAAFVRGVVGKFEADDIRPGGKYSVRSQRRVSHINSPGSRF